MTVTRKFVDDLDEESFAAKAITVTSAHQEPPPKEKKPRAKKPVLLEQVSLKLHPDTVREIERIAAEERKLPSEVMRDLIGRGLRAR
jgi:hypothetical protein